MEIEKILCFISFKYCVLIEITEGSSSQRFISDFLKLKIYFCAAPKSGVDFATIKSIKRSFERFFF